MQAQVRLNDSGPVTYTACGITLRRGVPQPVANAQHIAFFQSCGDVTVTILDAAPKKAKKPKKPKAPVVKTVDKEPEDDEDDEDDEEPDGEEPDGEEPDGEEPDGEEDDAPYSPEELEAMSKKELVALGTEDFKLELDMSMKKADLVLEVLEAQAKAGAES